MNLLNVNGETTLDSPFFFTLLQLLCIVKLLYNAYIPSNAVWEPTTCCFAYKDIC
jgi:hypothetical protein